MAPNPIVRSLDSIATSFPFFAKDQVLTCDQLNQLAQYLDDGERLTRVRLLGVGLVSGLRLSGNDKALTLSAGIGITTDGDLIHCEAARRFDQWKPYDQSYPAYAPFYKGASAAGEMYPAVELLPHGFSDPLAKPLSALPGYRLAGAVAVLLVESHHQSPELCTGTGCDNKGGTQVNTLRLVLVDSAAADRFKEQITLPGDIWAQLPELAAERAMVTSAVATSQALAGVYRTVCSAISARLGTALKQLWSVGRSFLLEVFPSDPTAAWVNRLAEGNAEFAANDANIQYYYDYLKDVVETFNALRDNLFGEITWPLPDLASFPKHLLLGSILSPSGSELYRTRFYPSPLTSRTVDTPRRARFLARKLDALLGGFLVTRVANHGICVTPSRFEDASLEERALPFYYTASVCKSWSYRLHMRGQDGEGYSYHAADNGAKGSAAAPLTYQIGHLPFYRVEGHQGQDISEVMSSLQAQIKSNNLPFAVAAVLIGTDLGRVFRPGVFYTDLHRVHYLLRQDAIRQLDEVKTFSQGLLDKVIVAAKSATIDTPPQQSPTYYQDLAASQHRLIASKVASAQAKLSRTYSQFLADPTWKQDLSDVMQYGGSLKRGLGKILQTDYNTPIDSVIASTHFDWLDGIEAILAQREKEARARRVFTNFVDRHPQIEHFAGVVRGGTLVLVHDESGRVVADFMLPYIFAELDESEDDQSGLAPAQIRPIELLQNSLTLQRSRDSFVSHQILSQLQPVLDDKLATQLEFVKSGIEAMQSVVQTTLRARELRYSYKDVVLGRLVQNAQSWRATVDSLYPIIASPGSTPEQVKAARNQVSQAEAQLVQALQNLAGFLDNDRIEFTSGSDGAYATEELSRSTLALSDAARQTVVKTLGQVKSANLKQVLGRFIG